MTSLRDLYAELKADVAAVVDPLLEHSQSRLRGRGDFLPHAAVLNAEGKVTLIGAMTIAKDSNASSPQILSMLHGGLRQMSREKVLVAIGVAENSNVTRAGVAVQAIKVLFEHERGLTVAMYLPYGWSEESGYFFGDPFVVPADPVLKVWPDVPEN